MRLALLHRILEVIAESRGFKPGDFDVTQKIASGAQTLTIAYRPLPGFCLTATGVRGTFQGTMSPGQIAETEHFTAASQDAFLDIVRSWLTWTHDELLARLPDEYFTRDEAAELAIRLDAVHADIERRLAKLGMTEAKLKVRMKEVEADVAVLKKTMQVVKKPSWVRAFMGRCLLWIRDSNNRAIVKDATEIARKLIDPR